VARRRRPTPTTRTTRTRPTTPTRATQTRIRPTQIRTRPTRASSLARAVDPVSAEEFLGEHWERKPLVVTRDEEGRFDDLLSLADLERLLCSGGLRYPAFRLVKAGEKLDVSSYTRSIPWRPAPFSGTAEIGRVLAEFEAGATLVLQGLHLSWPPLARFCRTLEGELGHPAQANAYFTPRDAQGLPIHHDTHEVLSLQVAGEKRWLVYEPVLQLPLKDQRYVAEMGAPGEPVHDVTLRAGDTLYLPRGWLHEATTSSSDSLHITVGVNVYTWLDALRAALDDCGDDVEFRRSPTGEADELVERLRARLEPEQVARRQRRRLVKTRRPILGGQLGQLRTLDGLTLETPLERRPTVLFDLDGLTLVFEGKEISFPVSAEEPIAFAAAAAGPFTPSELPGELDDEGRLVLVRRLVREGFLRISEDAPRTGADAAG
jgi:ribosomal protein L16 Arg81 hydroxylase